ncbi:MAG: hypothetical protein K0S47_406 [Herbinix sp.]|jgi:acetyltransferase-like isoleucine patch superfamily enzyme|nr:hypothetical protein [Herbinix sp.]
MRERVKEFLKKNKKASSLIAGFYTLLGNNRIRGRRGNKLMIENAYMKSCKISIHGKNNLIIIKDYGRLVHCSITIHGDNNRIILGEGVSAYLCEFYLEDKGNQIIVGKDTHINGKTHIACIEGCKIKIGERCLFSSEVVLRTGDSHSIINLDGTRINESRNIILGDHIWIGHRVTLTKGVVLGTNSIVATGAIVTKPFHKTNVILGGIPAKIIKKDINWDEQRI